MDGAQKTVARSVEKAQEVFAGYIDGQRNCEATMNAMGHILDDLKQKGPQDRSRISMTEEHEARY